MHSSLAPASVIFGLSGPELTSDEVAFFSDIQPYGFILFARNCESPKQVQALTNDLRQLARREHLPILIDQEGGRVARLKPPHWPKYPPAAAFAEIAEKQGIVRAERATYLNARLIAHDLYSLGITVDCAPLADVPAKGAHDVIGDRAFGHEPAQVIALARAQAKGLMDGGIVPVLKHIPGHGRAAADSHEELPVVHVGLKILQATDFVPFKALSDLPMGMTAHVLYSAIDKALMATVSPLVIELIRSELQFKGLLMSDDLSMKAMQGDYTQRAQDVLAAGCDVVLHCNGKMVEMEAVAKGIKPLAGHSLARAELAMKAAAAKPQAFDVEETRAQVTQMLAAG